MPEEFKKLPTHIAIIMDGNGRWATARGLPRAEGHRVGTEAVRRVVRSCIDFGIKYLTIYAFSTENWARPQEEVNGLMMLLETVVVNELDELHREGVRIQHIGRLESLPAGLGAKIKKAVEVTRNNQRLVFTIAWNYGGRDEIICAIQNIIKDGIAPENVTEELVSSYLFTSNSPDPELLIRTSGEQRLSNFLLWQTAYSEWVVTPVFWPDFDKEDLRKAIIEYGNRDRRFGKVSSK
ncbi:MAG TPA: isoprenyl transferase [Leptolinea sp.]